MKILGSDVRNSAGIGLLRIVPLLLLEQFAGSGLANRRDVWALFVMLYVLAAGFLIVLMGTVRAVRSQGDTGRMFRLLVGGGAFVVLAGAWLLIVADQLPCFWGVPYCD